MAHSFKIPNSAYDGLTVLVKLGPAKLGQLAEKVRKERLTLDVDLLAAKLADEIGTDADDLELAFDSVLLPLSGLRQEFRMEPEEFVDLLADLIERQKPEWLKANQDGWKSVVPLVEQFIGADGFFGLLNKAYRLLLNHPALMEGARILAELRPVYDESASTIKAYLIASTLVVNYQEFGESKRLHLTMDKQDLLRVQEQVDRALKKIELLEKQVALLEVPSLVAGSDRS